MSIDVETNMYETQQTKIVARSILIGLLLAICGVLSYEYLSSKRPKEPAPAVIDYDACQHLCLPQNGVEKFEGGTCFCRPPPKPEAPDHMYCDCTSKDPHHF